MLYTDAGSWLQRAGLGLVWAGEGSGTGASSLAWSVCLGSSYRSVVSSFQLRQIIPRQGSVCVCVCVCLRACVSMFFSVVVCVREFVHVRVLKGGLSFGCTSRLTAAAHV